MDTLLKLGFVFLLVCGGLLAMGYSQNGRADPLLVAGTIFGLFLAALYFIPAARRRNAEKAMRKVGKRNS